ncbi:hypothetical protein HU200_019517 [Digitaria exilis]|uniref:Uncharacterized protein n=1 Tax=Digitaria exilis TaxID=1010633 RepID=A0A835F3G8_9POAL|nr:hypothetical protein HU200_019517 [Digitaria exilis]
MILVDGGGQNRHSRLLMSARNDETSRSSAPGPSTRPGLYERPLRSLPSSKHPPDSSSSSSCTSLACSTTVHLRLYSCSSVRSSGPSMELAASTSASVCSAAYHHLSAAADSDGGAQVASEQKLARRPRRKKRGGGCAGLRRRCYAVLKQQRTRLYILRRCVTMLLCWHEHDDLSD